MGYADELLRAIDNKYCVSGEKLIMPQKKIKHLEMVELIIERMG